jgi:hypothetical protein
MGFFVQKYINLYLHKITKQNAISVAIQIVNCFWVKMVSVHNLLVYTLNTLEEIRRYFLAGL